jgi:RimJ/RimL family protein N-acetyltransferase
MKKEIAETVVLNKPSVRIANKCGFKLEGRIREKNFVRGKWVDEIDYGLLKSEWKKANNEK